MARQLRLGLILFSSALFGCGGGGTGGGGGNGGGMGRAVSWQQRNVVMDAAGAKLESFPVGTDLDTENAALLNYVKTLPNVKSAELDQGSITVTLSDDT